MGDYLGTIWEMDADSFHPKKGTERAQSQLSSVSLSIDYHLNNIPQSAGSQQAEI